MNPLDFMSVAQDLAKPGRREANYRTAVSRAYYAAFNYAQALVVQWGFNPPPAADAHEKVKRWLQNSGVMAAEEAGNVLDDLRKERNNADYRMGMTGFDQNKASLVIAKARLSVQTLETLDAQAVQEGIRAYLIRINERPV